MNKSILASLFFALCFHMGIQAQSLNEDPVLFYIDDDTVRLSEFRYIYEKNNRDSLRNSRESISDYLELYVKFKLKVRAARDEGLDTIKALQDELSMYRQQLAKNYLIDKEVEEAIARSVFERKKKDLHISHILISVKKDEDTTAAYQMAITLLDSLKKHNVTFEEIALRHSQDPFAKKNKGDLGYLTAIFPPGFENFEHLAYNMEEGEIGGPTRTKAGYHIVKLHDIRPARGTVKIAHILVRKPEINNEAQIAMTKDDILDAYRALESGESWKSVLRKYTEDKKSISQNGLIGDFSIGIYEPSLEEAAFSLESDSAFSKPVESSIGWHILRRLERQRPQDQSFEDVKKDILVELEKTGRLEAAQKALIEKIKRSAPFRLYDDVYADFKANNLEQFTNYKWQAPEIDSPEILLSLGSEVEKTNLDFVRFLKKNTRERLRLAHRLSNEEAADHMLEQFVNESAIEYEQASLEDKYPDFRNLMREYREGILLFEVTKEKIWDRAPQDTVGLEEYYRAHKKDYMWNERAKLLTFTASPENRKEFEKMMDLLKKKGVSPMVEKFNKDTTLVTYESSMIEKGKKDISGIPWKKGALYNIQEINGVYTFQYVQEIKPAEPKTLSEARGFVISDYQSQLELDWINYLEKKYSVKVVDEVFNELVESYQ